MTSKTLAALASTMLLVCAGGTAHASTQIPCQSGCTTDSTGFAFRDYTILGDGLRYEWDIRNDSAATITLSSPNEVFSEGFYSDGQGGQGASYFDGSAYLFQETATPGFTRIIVWGPADFDHCATTFTVGELCAVSHDIWGNATVLVASPRQTVEYFITVSQVPEPTAWALLLTGFFGLGAAIRSRRVAWVQP